MGTKLQYALNPLSNTSNNSFAVNKIADWGYSQEFGVRGPLERSVMHHSMDEMFGLQSQKIESIKKTMLMHEDIFQRQVRELHRLYDRQMKLMCELKEQMVYTCGPLGMKDAKISQFSIWQKQVQDIRFNLPVYNSTYDSGELSASCSGESQRMPKGFNLEMVAEECPSTSIHPTEQDQEGPNSYRPSPSIQINTGASDEDIDVELTLSIGGSNSRKRSNNERKPCSLELEGLGSTFCRRQFSSSGPMKRETREDFGEPSPALSSSSATQNRDNTTSNWLLQDLSLNRT